MKILFFTPFDMINDLEDAFPLGSTPTDEQIEEIIYANACCETNVEDIYEHTHWTDVIHLLNNAQNYDNYTILYGNEPYYKYFTGETK